MIIKFVLNSSVWLLNHFIKCSVFHISHFCHCTQFQCCGQIHDKLCVERKLWCINMQSWLITMYQFCVKSRSDHFLGGCLAQLLECYIYLMNRYKMAEKSKNAGYIFLKRHLYIIIKEAVLSSNTDIFHMWFNFYVIMYLFNICNCWDNNSLMEIGTLDLQ